MAQSSGSGGLPPGARHSWWTMGEEGEDGVEALAEQAGTAYAEGNHRMSNHLLQALLKHRDNGIAAVPLPAAVAHPEPPACLSITLLPIEHNNIVI